MKIITESKRVDVLEYHREFDSIDGLGCDFAFSCDKEGNIDRSKLSEEALRNLDKCLADGGKTIVDKGIICNAWDFFEDAVGKCDCGENVILSYSDNECTCGRLYNMYGQELRRLSKEEQYWENANDDAYASEELY